MWWRWWKIFHLTRFLPHVHADTSSSFIIIIIAECYVVIQQNFTKASKSWCWLYLIFSESDEEIVIRVAWQVRHPTPCLTPTQTCVWHSLTVDPIVITISSPGMNNHLHKICIPNWFKFEWLSTQRKSLDTKKRVIFFPLDITR